MVLDVIIGQNNLGLCMLVTGLLARLVQVLLLFNKIQADRSMGIRQLVEVPVDLSREQVVVMFTIPMFLCIGAIFVLLWH